MVVFKKVALIGKYKSVDIAKPMQVVVGFLRQRKIDVVMEDQTCAQLNLSDIESGPLGDIVKESDLVIVLGGDGTMLGVAGVVAEANRAPLLGINQGRLGFLTDISVETMLDSLNAVISGEFEIDERLMLKVRLKERVHPIIYALNDISVSKGQSGSLMEMEVTIDSKLAYRLRADGLIVATPTGSTAYALSAGGPILDPSLSAISLVPVSPHTLSNRPIVIPGESSVEITLTEGIDARMHVDSHTHLDVGAGASILISRAENPLRLIHPQGHDHFRTLREKLRWASLL
jgi:NAD+ kinase